MRTDPKPYQPYRFVTSQQFVFIWCTVVKEYIHVWLFIALSLYTNWNFVFLVFSLFFFYFPKLFSVMLHTIIFLWNVVVKTVLLALLNLRISVPNHPITSHKNQNLCKKIIRITSAKWSNLLQALRIRIRDRTTNPFRNSTTVLDRRKTCTIVELTRMTMQNRRKSQYQWGNLKIMCWLYFYELLILIGLSVTSVL